MSYITKTVAKPLQLAEITLSGQPSANGYFTFNTLNLHNFTTAPTGLGTDSLSLPAGSYMFRAVLDITRTNSQHNYTFQFEANSSLIGKEGFTGMAYNWCKADVAEATHSSTSSFTLKLEALTVESGVPTLTNNSKCFIWRVD